MTNRYAVKKYSIASTEEMEAKKAIAIKINQFIRDNKLTIKMLKNILKLSVNKVTSIKQMSLSRFSSECLEGFLEQLKRG